MTDRASVSGRPRILSPRGDRTYLSRAADAEDQTRGLMLRAEAAPDASRIYWFADRVFLGTSTSLESLAWQPSPGKYHLRAMDDRGRSTICTVTLQAAR